MHFMVLRQHSMCCAPVAYCRAPCSPPHPPDGNVVTNYHVLASVLGGAAGKVAPGAKVARVLLLNGEGVQQAYDGFLVGEKAAADAADADADAAAAAVAAPAAANMLPLPETARGAPTPRLQALTRHATWLSSRSMPPPPCCARSGWKTRLRCASARPASPLVSATWHRGGWAGPVAAWLAGLGVRRGS